MIKEKESKMTIMGMMPEDKLLSHIDVAHPEYVEISIKHDNKVIWVNVNGICMFRACNIKNLTITKG